VWRGLNPGNTAVGPSGKRGLGSHHENRENCEMVGQKTLKIDKNGVKTAQNGKKLA